MSETEVSITRLGARGDGIADGPTPLYVPNALPGETVRVRIDGDRGTVVARLNDAPERIAPPCRHFGICGGCAAQHMGADTYAAWKRGIVVQALERQGLDAPVAALVRVPPGGRRRAEFAARKTRAGTVLRPVLAALTGPLRALLTDLLRPGEACDVLVTEAANGRDLVLTCPRAPDGVALAAFAEAHGVLRVSWRNGAVEPVVVAGTPRIAFAGIDVELPPGAFLQADAAAEAALRAAAGAAGLGGRVTSETRDLNRRPINAAELTSVDAVIFDPPYAGARAQAEALAVSAVPTVVAVSCNPATFARDARTLVGGGYVLKRVVPVDQFVWSAEVELVAVLRR